MLAIALLYPIGGLDRSLLQPRLLGLGSSIWSSITPCYLGERRGLGLVLDVVDHKYLSRIGSKFRRHQQPFRNHGINGAGASHVQPSVCSSGRMLTSGPDSAVRVLYPLLHLSLLQSACDRRKANLG